MKQVSSELQVKHGISQSEGEALRLGREGAWQRRVSTMVSALCLPGGAVAPLIAA